MLHAFCYLPNIVHFNIKFILKLVKATIFMKVGMMENVVDIFNFLYWHNSDKIKRSEYDFYIIILISLKISYFCKAYVKISHVRM